MLFSTPTFRRTPGESKLKLKHVERHLYRLRDPEYPERPATHEKVREKFNEPEIVERFGRTMNMFEKFYAGSIVETLFAFHVWASFATINIIKSHITPDKRNYLLDGTFKVIPSTSKLFSQLLIISIEYKNDVSISNSNLFMSKFVTNNNAIPFSFCLLDLSRFLCPHIKSYSGVL